MPGEPRRAPRATLWEPLVWDPREQESPGPTLLSLKKLPRCKHSISGDTEGMARVPAEVGEGRLGSAFTRLRTGKASEGAACELSDKASRQGPETRCGQGSWHSLGQPGQPGGSREGDSRTPVASRSAGAAFHDFLLVRWAAIGGVGRGVLLHLSKLVRFAKRHPVRSHTWARQVESSHLQMKDLRLIEGKWQGLKPQPVCPQPGPHPLSFPAPLLVPGTYQS